MAASLILYCVAPGWVMRTCVKCHHSGLHDFTPTQENADQKEHGTGEIAPGFNYIKAC